MGLKLDGDRAGLLAVPVRKQRNGDGFGSRKELRGQHRKRPKALFWKARKFVETLPVEFSRQLERKTPYARWRTGAVIKGRDWR